MVKVSAKAKNVPQCLTTLDSQTRGQSMSEGFLVGNPFNIDFRALARHDTATTVGPMFYENFDHSC